ncbi:hypothetical protein BDW72DRAFT_208044 [Aspergillus terricola var. indicus]
MCVYWITGFDQVAHLYNLQYTGAKELNNSAEVIDALQNIILQHVDIYTFVQHYKVDINIDVQGIIWKTESQTPWVRFACLFSVLINPDWPFRLSAEESKSLKTLPEVLFWQEKVNKRKWRWEYCKAKLQHAIHSLKNYNQSPRVKEELENLEDNTMDAKRRYNIAIHELEEQPVIGLEQQLAGKLVNTKVRNTLEHKSFMTPQHLVVIDALLTMPGTTLEAERQRRIHASEP